MTATSEPTTESTVEPTAGATSEATPQPDAPTTVLTRPGASRLSRRALLGRVGLGGLAALLAGGALAGSPVYAQRYAGRVYPGVSVAGVPLGGLTREEATARLAAAGQRYAVAPLRVTGSQGGQGWTVALGELRLAYNYPAAVERALATHRGDDRWDRYIGGFAALLGSAGGSDTPLPAAIDDDLLLRKLHEWAGAATTAPTNATFASAADGQLTIAPDRSGVGIAFDGTRDAFLARAARLSTEPVALAMEPVGAAVTTARLGTLLPQARAIVAQPIALESGGRRWPIDAAALRAAVGYREDGERLALTIDTAPFRPVVQEAARAIGVPAASARIVRGNDGRFAIEQDRAGASLDEAATLAAIERALLGGTPPATVAIVTKSERPAIVAADLEPAFNRLNAILNTPLVVTYQEYKFTLYRGDILPLLILEDAPNTPEKLRITTDTARVAEVARELAGGIDRPARDAEFRWLDGAVRVTKPAEDGRATQVEATATALAAAILGATGSLTPTVAPTKAKIDGSAAAGIVIGERLAYGDTDYSFSIAPRKHNVELAMERLNGALIPPDGLFSFNATVGEQTIANGYQAAYGIAMVGGPGGQAQTVSSIGGGICQVATTLFQPVYRVGLPVEERNWHLYWIPNYGQPPSGLQGLDATVDDQAKVDLKFRNTTGGWLAIEASTKGGRVNIALRGTNPGWQVQIDPPVITNVRKADQTQVIEKTHDLPVGQRLEVEHAVDGFDAANHIVVRDASGKVLRDVTFRSNYLPSRNVTQVGVPKSEPLT